MAGQCEAQQLAYLRRQIEMRSIGLGWVQYSTKYSSQSDRKIGTVAHLQQLLVGDILPEEMALRRLKRLPVEAAPPHHEAQDLGQLGSADEDAMEIASTVRSSKLTLVYIQNPFSASLCGHFFAGDHAFFEPEQPFYT